MAGKPFQLSCQGRFYTMLPPATAGSLPSDLKVGKYRSNNSNLHINKVQYSQEW